MSGRRIVHAGESRRARPPLPTHGGSPGARIAMADHIVPHFHNDVGVPVVEIGAKEFMCIGATPPFDHPHVFLDMGDASEVICPYCSTLYRRSADLHGAQSRPPECTWVAAAAV